MKHNQRTEFVTVSDGRRFGDREILQRDGNKRLLFTAWTNGDISVAIVDGIIPNEIVLLREEFKNVPKFKAKLIKERFKCSSLQMLLMDKSSIS